MTEEGKRKEERGTGAEDDGNRTPDVGGRTPGDESRPPETPASAPDGGIRNPQPAIRHPEPVAVDRAEYDRLVAEAAKVSELTDLVKRTRADLLNYQDRARREREEAVQYGAVKFLLELLPAVDSLRDSVGTYERMGAPKEVVEGLRLLDREMHRVLSKAGVERIESAGKPFDPREHQAIGSAPVAEAERDGLVVEEARAGYRMGDRVLRAALVRVGSHQEGQGNVEGTAGTAAGGA